MKRLSLVFTLIMCLVLVTGCTSNFELKEEPYKVADKILDASEFPDMVKLYNGNKENPENVDAIIEMYYGLKTKDFKNYAVYYAGSGGTSDEIAIIEFADKKEADKNKAAFEKRITERKNVFSGYAPDEVKKLEKAKVEVKGKYVYMIISSDPDKALKIFNDSKK